jgi:hypothetical protein
MRQIKFKICLIAVAAVVLGVSPINGDRQSGMIYIGGGDYHEKDSTRIKPFLIDKYLVAVAEFEAFVSATGYVTEAEQFGDGGVFDPGMQSWFLKPGASSNTQWEKITLLHYPTILLRRCPGMMLRLIVSGKVKDCQHVPNGNLLRRKGCHTILSMPGEMT